MALYKYVLSDGSIGISIKMKSPYSSVVKLENYNMNLPLYDIQLNLKYVKNTSTRRFILNSKIQ